MKKEKEKDLVSGRLSGGQKSRRRTGASAARGKTAYNSGRLGITADHEEQPPARQHAHRTPTGPTPASAAPDGVSRPIPRSAPDDLTVAWQEPGPSAAPAPPTAAPSLTDEPAGDTPNSRADLRHLLEALWTQHRAVAVTAGAGLCLVLVVLLARGGSEDAATTPSSSLAASPPSAAPTATPDPNAVPASSDRPSVTLQPTGNRSHSRGRSSGSGGAMLERLRRRAQQQDVPDRQDASRPEPDIDRHSRTTRVFIPPAGLRERPRPTAASAPPDVSAEPERPQTIPCPPDISVTGIVKDPSGNLAIINDNFIRVGDRVRGALVLEITGFSVTMERDGKRFLAGVGAGGAGSRQSDRDEYEEGEEDGEDEEDQTEEAD